MTKYGQVPDATRSWDGLNAVPDEVLIVRSNNGTLWRRTPGGQGSGDWQYQAHPGGMWRDAVPMFYEPGQQPFHEITFPALETPTQGERQCAAGEYAARRLAALLERVEADLRLYRSIREDD